MVKRGDVYWVNLDPTVGTEIKKTRPCLIPTFRTPIIENLNISKHTFGQAT